MRRAGHVLDRLLLVAARQGPFRQSDRLRQGEVLALERRRRGDGVVGRQHRDALALGGDRLVGRLVEEIGRLDDRAARKAHGKGRGDGQGAYGCAGFGQGLGRDHWAPSGWTWIGAP
jgi:hypothetical protein